jgi:hypothetical protein
MATGINGAPQRLEARSFDEEGTAQMLHRGSGREVWVNTIQERDFIVAYATAQGSGSMHPPG